MRNTIIGILLFGLLIPAISSLTAQVYPLSVEDKEGIAFMVEEEKMARDVYLNLNEKWDKQVFANISRAEQTHMDHILAIAKEHDLELSASVKADKPGIFDNDEIQGLYDEFITRGNQSLKEALLVGAMIEEVDIKDLDDYLAITENKALESMYLYLKGGSENHLRAFVRNLNNMGLEYEPVILSPVQFQSVIVGSQSNGKANAAGCQHQGEAKGKACSHAGNKKNCKNQGKGCCKKAKS